MKKINGRQWMTILATLATITINVLANTLPINGLYTGDISDRFDIYFVPAGYVFSIWGVIYIGWLVYSVFQALPSQAENPVLKKIAPWYWISSLGNIAWIFLWHYEVFAFTLLFMVLILASLLVVNRALAGVEGQTKWYVKLPFSLYLGWISVATIANASQWLYFFDWSGWGIQPATWAVIMLAVASLLGILMAWLENDTFYTLVLIWAFIGITVSQAGASLVVLAAWTGVALLAVALLGSFLKFKKIY
ncbi:MAG: tryptophan-rich sensory protein [Anaerolineales bacterium]